MKLRDVAHSRTGDKGTIVNVSLIAFAERDYPRLARVVTAARVKQHFIGLITGGLLTRYAGWQYIFYLNVPIGTAALLLAPRFVPESRLETAGRRFDASGALTATGGLVPAVFKRPAILQVPARRGIGWGAADT